MRIYIYIYIVNSKIFFLKFLYNKNRLILLLFRNEFWTRILNSSSLFLISIRSISYLITLATEIFDAIPLLIVAKASSFQCLRLHTAGREIMIEILLSRSVSSGLFSFDIIHQRISKKREKNV